MARRQRDASLRTRLPRWTVGAGCLHGAFPQGANGVPAYPTAAHVRHGIHIAPYLRLPANSSPRLLGLAGWQLRLDPAAMADPARARPTKLALWFLDAKRRRLRLE